MNGVNDPQQGNSYTWIALERHGNPVVAYDVDRRTNLAADAFAEKLDLATAGHFQVSSNAFPACATTHLPR